MKHFSRRNLFAATAALPLAALAQQDATVPKSTTREDDLKSARELISNNAALLAKVEVPMATEPAFVFKA